MAFVWTHITTANTQSPVYHCLSHAHGAWSCRGEMCNFLGSVSLQQKFDTSVTAQFYLASKGKYILEVWGWADSKEERRSILTPPFMFFSPPPPTPQPAVCKLGYWGGLFISPEVLTLVLGSTFVLCSWGFSFLCLLAAANLDSSFLF